MTCKIQQIILVFYQHSCTISAFISKLYRYTTDQISEFFLLYESKQKFMSAQKSESPYQALQSRSHAINQSGLNNPQVSSSLTNNKLTDTKSKASPNHEKPLILKINHEEFVRYRDDSDERKQMLFHALGNYNPEYEWATKTPQYQMIASEIQEYRDSIQTVDDPSDPDAFTDEDLQEKLRVEISKALKFQHSKFPKEFSQFIGKYSGEGKQTQIQIYPNPNGESSFVFLTGCANNIKSEMQIYKIENGGNQNTSLHMTKIVDDIHLSSCPQAAWHHKVYQSDMGLIYLTIEGYRRVKLQIFEYKNEQIFDILQFSIQGALCHAYLFEQIDQMAFSCQTIDDLRSSLNNAFVCIWTYWSQYEGIQVMMLGQPDRILYENKGFRPNASWQPIYFNISKDPSFPSTNSQSERILYLRGQNTYNKGDQEIVLLINHHGTIQESRDDALLTRHLKERTEHLTLDLFEYPEYGSHLCVQEGDKYHIKTAKDLSQFQNVHFAKPFLQILKIKGQVAVQVGEESMMWIDKDGGHLKWVLFRKGYVSQKDINTAFPPLNGFPSSYGLNHWYSKYNNVMIEIFNDNYIRVHVYFSRPKKWEYCQLRSLDEKEKKLLEPFLKGTSFQEWDLEDWYKDIKGLGLMYRGGILVDGHSQIDTMSDDLECLVTTRNHQDLIHPPEIHVAKKAQFERALLLETPQYQTGSQDGESPTGLIAVHTKQADILTNPDEYLRKEIDVEGISFVMLGKDKEGKKRVLAQYALSFKYQHKLNGLYHFVLRNHNEWNHCQASEWIKVKKIGRWVNQVDYAICELTDNHHLIQIKVIRFLSVGEDDEEPSLYQVGAKLIYSKQKLCNGETKLQPRFDEQNRIIGCWLKVGKEEYAIYYPQKNPDESNTITKSILTNQTYTIFASQSNHPSVLLVETQFTRLFEQNEIIFSTRQKQDILRQSVALMLDMVPNAYPQDVNSKPRTFSNYQCLQGRKPCQETKLTPNEFKTKHEDRDIGHKTLIDIFMDKDDPQREILKQWQLYEDFPLSKRNVDGQTLLREAIQSKNLQMVKVMTNIIFEEHEEQSCQKASGVVMSNILEITRAGEMILQFRDFFENVNHDGVETKGPQSEVRFQMHDHKIEVPTHSDQEQTLIVHDITSSLQDQCLIFDQICSNQVTLESTFKIDKVLVNLEWSSYAQKIELFNKGEPAEKEVPFNDYQTAELVHNLIHLLPPDSINSQIFSRKWTDEQFKKVKWFFYSILTMYVVHLYSQMQLILNKQENGMVKYFYIGWMIMFTAISSLQEMIQMRNGVKAYLSNPQNIVEALQIVFNIIFIAMKISAYQYINVYFAYALLCLSMVKLQFQLRIFGDLGPLVLLIFQCMRDTRDFVIYLFILIVFFVQVNLIFGANVGGHLTSIDEYTSNYIKMFRSSVGDLHEPSFTCSLLEDCKNISLTIWSLFVCMVFVMTVIPNNFLIAKVSQSYETFLDTAVLAKYKNRIYFVKQYLLYMNFIQNNCSFQVMDNYTLIVMFQTVEENSQDVSQESLDGTIQGIKKTVCSVKTQVTNLTQELMNKFQANKEEIRAEMKEEIDAVKADIKDVRMEMKAMREEIINLLMKPPQKR